MKTVLIFGCAGFVGKYLIQEFMTHGYTVDGSDLTEPDEKLTESLRCYTQADLLNPQEVEQVVSNSQPDYIVNLAAISSVGMSWKIPQKTISVNVNGSLNILEAVRKLKLHPKILLIGSSEEYSASEGRISEAHPICATNPYGISKVSQELFSEMYRKEYGLNIINTRTFNHTGIGQPDTFVIPSFVKQVADIHNSRKPGVISVGNLSACRDFGDVRDMVSAYRMILESKSNNKVYNVGNGQCYSLEHILQYIISLTPEKVTVQVAQDKMRPVDNPVIWCDNNLLRTAVGWEPRYEIFETIKAMFAEMIE